jgi:hypothetical protein
VRAEGDVRRYRVVADIRLRKFLAPGECVFNRDTPFELPDPYEPLGPF